MNFSSLIEKAVSEFREKFVGKAPDYHTPDHQNLPSRYVEKMMKIDDLESFLEEKLKEIALATARAGELKGKRSPDYHNDTSNQVSMLARGTTDGWNACVAASKRKMEEFTGK